MPVGEIEYLLGSKVDKDMLNRQNLSIEKTKYLPYTICKN